MPKKQFYNSQELLDYIRTTHDAELTQKKNELYEAISSVEEQMDDFDFEKRKKAAQAASDLESFIIND